MPSDPTVVFTVDTDLVHTLERVYGPPIDSYLNGWQVWVEPCELRGAEDEEVQLELRLHTPAGFAQPRGLSHHDLWDAVIEQLAEGAEDLRLGEEHRTLDELWVLLEVYPAFGDEVTPDELARVTGAALGRAPRARGRVDHGRLGAAWKRTKGRFDLAGALLDELDADPPDADAPDAG